MSLSRCKMVCDTCGSDMVTVDAYVEWDEERQAWDVSWVGEAGYCDVCEAPRDIVREPTE